MYISSISRSIFDILEDLSIFLNLSHLLWCMNLKQFDLEQHFEIQIKLRKKQKLLNKNRNILDLYISLKSVKDPNGPMIVPIANP